MNFSPTKMLSVMKMTVTLLLATVMQVSASSYAQTVNLRAHKMPLEKVFSTIGKQTGYAFFWDQQVVRNLQPVDVDLHNASLKEAMKTCLANQPLTFDLAETDKSVFIRTRAAENKVTEDQQQLITVTGRVTDDSKEPLAGVTVTVKGTGKGAATNGEGIYTIPNVDPKAILVFSMMGFQTHEMPVNGRGQINITLAKKVQNISEVMITTGIFSRKKESFTGDAAVYSGDQLRTVSNQNVIQSLRSLDPAFILLDNNIAGSNPNVMPNMSIRGKTSIIGTVDKFARDPNQPLFIIDGFESSIENVMALDMNRVANVTILKDASSTAIYGSKGANGVIVIDTKLPRAGKMNLSAVYDNSFYFADLRDYNMMNAAEKLEFERLTNTYIPKDASNTTKWNDMNERYNRNLNNVLSGVNTYWMGYPIRPTTLANSYSLQADGGDTKFRYAVGGRYSTLPGVMKGSDRNTASGNLDLIYRPGKFSFTNRTMLTTFTADDSPYGNFSDWVKAVPYYKPSNDKYLGYGLSPYVYDTVLVYNPIYQMKLPKMDRTKNVNLRNNISAYYQFNDHLRIDGRASITYSNQQHEIYKSPLMKDFDKKEASQKGLYKNSTDRGLSYEAYLQASYGKMWHNTHELNLVPGFNVSSNSITSDGYAATGFPAVDKIYPGFASGYPTAGVPDYAKSVSRSASFFLNGYYGYKRRYMIDAIYRKDGSSIFGSSVNHTNTWTLGLSWNLHNESFFKNIAWVNFLKLRGSLGNPGNQNFSSYNSFTTMAYNRGVVNSFGLGTNVYAWGNSDLAWQKTLMKTVGIDARLLDERISITANLYNNLTDPMIISIDNAPSTGSSSIMYNIGHSRVKGYDLALSATVLSNTKERFYVRLSASTKKETTTYGGLGNILDQLNKNNAGLINSNNKDSYHDYSNIAQNLERYMDGGHPNDLWAVRSMGVDPGTGKELYLDKNGNLTYTYDAVNVVNVGNTYPKMQGTVGVSVQYKGFSLNSIMRYKWKSYQFNNALFSKVENLTRQQVMAENLDKRALYNRWKKVGDKAEFTNIPDLRYGTSTTDISMSSRFIQEENSFTGESLSLSYDFYANKFIRKIGLQSLSVSGYMNDFFYLSNLRRERGIDYPYARSCSFKLMAAF